MIIHTGLKPMSQHLVRTGPRRRAGAVIMICVLVAAVCFMVWVASR